jgi:protein O-GlcNAc transferase
MTIANPDLNAGEEALQRRDYTAAEQAFSRFATEFPGSPVGAFGMGMAAEGAGNFALAAARYRQALTIDPGMADIHYNLGNVERQLGNHAAARTAFENAARLRPGFDAPIVNLAVMLRELGDIPGAIAVAKRGAARAPEGSLLHTLLSELQDTVG